MRFGVFKILAAVAIAGMAACDAPSPTGEDFAPTPAFYTFPSSNDTNRQNDLPHVNMIDVGVGYATLEFVNATNSLAFFEYRIDGVTVGTTSHPVVDGDVIHPGVCVDGRDAAVCDAGPVVRTLNAQSLIEVRLALGGERDWDFDWTQFYVATDVQSKEECKDNWQAYSFANQGLCIRFIETGRDSR
jgi:hypothetical protein